MLPVVERPYQGSMPNAYPPDYSARQIEPVVVRLRPHASSGGFPKFLLFLACSGLLVLLAIACATILGALGYYQVTERILPGVKVGKLDLGGMTQDEASMMLDKTWNIDSRILVTNGSQNQTLSPAQLGLTLDSKLTAQRAFDYAHSGTFFDRLIQTTASLKGGWQIKPEVSIDPETARSALEALVPLLSQPAKDAGVSLNGTQLVAVPAELGYTINIEETVQVLQFSPQEVLATGALQIIPKPVLPAVIDAAPALEDAQRLLDRSNTVNVYDPVSDERISVPVPREIMASWIRIVPGDPVPQVVLDPDTVAGFLTGLKGQLGQDRYIEAAQFSAPLAEALKLGSTFWVTASHHPTSYIVQPGDTMLKLGWKLGMPYWMIVQANPGLDPESLSTGVELTIPSKDKLLPLPVIANKRILISLSKQRLTVFQDGNQIRQYVISTGIDRSPTQPGVFQVQTHEPNAYASVWDLYMPNFLGIYEAWPGFMNGIHGLPTLSNGQRLWANILGSPASYGCIILGLNEAEWLYNWAENGVVVEIRN
jgi:lipoprotein-anchoring transpeptidase ErfK/SrfK